MSQTVNTKRVLLEGQQPETVDFSDPACCPASTPRRFTPASRSA